MSTSRADRALSKLESRLGLTPPGKAWLTAILDPFHDEEIPGLVGIPDGQNTRSCVQIVRSTKQVSCPASVTTGTWDCSVISFPYFSPGEGINTGNTTGYCPSVGSGGPTLMAVNTFLTSDVASTQITLGGVTAYSNATSVGKTGPESNSTIEQLNIPQTFVEGEYRIIAKGYEIASVGPDLYKSGTVYVWNQPSPSDESTTPFHVMRQVGETTAVDGYLPCMVYDQPPQSVGEANVIPNTKSWPAREGVYIVDRLPSESFCSYTNNITGQIYRDPTRATQVNVVDWVPAWGPAASEQSTSLPPGFTFLPTFLQYAGSAVSTFHHSGAFFTGLSLQDTLTINAVWYIERFPSIQEQDLLVLAKPTPCRDTVAMEIYSLCLESMPVGMYFSANGFGDWFNDVVNTVSDFVSPVASAIGEFVPGPVGMIAKTASKAFANRKESQAQKKKAINDSPSPVSVQPAPKKAASKLPMKSKIPVLKKKTKS